jgi:hypothetical protein
MDFISNSYYVLSLLTNFRTNKDKNIIIDPLSCLIKLSILRFYPEKTKISIADNMITIVDPGMLQGAYRFIKGDDREDLHNLYVPLIKSIEWFWNDNNTEIKNLFDFAISGLENLKSSYPINSVISHTLDLYIYHLTTKKTKNFQNNDIKYNNTDTNNEIHDFVKQLWSHREIHIIIELLLEYDKTFKENKNEKHILSSILELTAAKELKLKEFLKNHFTSL